jgi:hypothetical protein
MNSNKTLKSVHPGSPVTHGIRLGQQGVAEGLEQQYLWHGSRQKIPMLEPRQAVDTGGAAGSNQNAIYATSDPIFATQMGMPAAGSDYGHFPNDPQMVLFSGKIRKGENVYLHKLPFYGPNGKPQFVQGGNDREFHSIPGVKAIKPVEIKAVPVDRYLNLVRQATPQDLELRKELTKEGVAEDIDLEERFNIIESMIEYWAEHHGVDSDVIWEDLEEVDDEDLLSEAEAWQTSRGKNKNGGLNKKGVSSYRSSHPGSHLQTAVTTKPSKLKPGSKAAKRRKSFCARMKGMKKHRTGSKTARDPNSRINKSLRKWNCH